MQGTGQMYHLADDPEEIKNLFGDEKYLKKQENLTGSYGLEVRNAGPFTNATSNKAKTLWI